MKSSDYLKMLSLIAVVMGYTSCQPKVASQVSSSITMTGASKAATVASKPSWMSLLLNKAYAFISPGMVDKNGASINLSTAWVVIKEIEFKAEEVQGAAEVDGSEITFQGPYFVDLLSNSPSPLDTQLIPEAAYKRIKMKLHASSSTLPSAVPTQLTNNSIYFAGTVSGNNFSFELDDSTELNIGGANPVMPVDGSSLLVEVNLANIFKQIDMSGVSNNEVISHSSRHAGSNLCPMIDASAADLYTCVRKGLEAHSDFGKDNDGNDDLGDTEDVK